jgi:hypothetical protein
LFNTLQRYRLLRQSGTEKPDTSIRRVTSVRQQSRIRRCLSLNNILYHPGLPVRWMNLFQRTLIPARLKSGPDSLTGAECQSIAFLKPPVP